MIWIWLSYVQSPQTFIRQVLLPCTSEIRDSEYGGIHLYCSNLSNRMEEKKIKNHGFVVQNGREVYKWAVTTVPKGINKLIENAEVTLNHINWFVPHSANLRMIESICEKSGFPMDRTLYSLVDYGNTSSATIPLSLDKGVREGKLKAGDNILLYGFGGGLAHCGLLIHWTI
ncbi:3-oxoacyl-[acyl-carrier-protein] synthase III [Scopulibacillus daqui]|uniref:3-oxoacyl-[acyl-carrier-protein] synthase III n=1 Tax=Scopulibacillus daqui TaxID=1469162 RepID=A0ABS2PVK3_9BACL|nr:3-oxoacyl-[acyl-carrier-protein] synthase III [Scopulibacillus daqui]